MILELESINLVLLNFCQLNKTYILLFFVLAGKMVFGQSAIYGKIDLGDSIVWDQKVYLSKYDVSSYVKDLKYATEIAWSPVAEDSSFSFDRKHIAESDAIYRLYVKRTENAISDTLLTSKAFISSSSDTVKFFGGATFETYTTTNLADREWQRLQEFERHLLQSQLTEKENAIQLKSFAKDSLRILMVKLMGVQALEEKQLLNQDIAKNPEYYLSLLYELQESEMPPAQYRFLEKKLAFLTQEVVQQKYAWSKIVNIILGLMVMGLAALLVFRRKSRPVLSDLSRQERNIQKLIVAGKTNKEIANELFISLSTVKTHITNIYSKLKVRNRQELLQKTQN